MNEKVDASAYQLQLIQAATGGSGNKWAKKAIAYAFKNIKISDVDFNKNDFDVSQIVKEKVIAAIRDAATPILTKLWLIITFHWATVAVIILLR